MKQLFFLSMLRLLFDFRSLYNIIGNLFESIRWNFSPFRERIQHLQLLIFLKLILSNNINKISYIVDIICKEQAGTEGNNDNKESLYIITRMQVSKPNRQYYGCSKIITPNVFLVPWDCVNTTDSHPTIIRMNMRNSHQNAC